MDNKMYKEKFMAKIKLMDESGYSSQIALEIMKLVELESLKVNIELELMSIGPALQEICSRLENIEDGLTRLKNK